MNIINLRSMIGGQNAIMDEEGKNRINPEKMSEDDEMKP